MVTYRSILERVDLSCLNFFVVLEIGCKIGQEYTLLLEEHLILLGIEEWISEPVLFVPL